MPNSKLRAFLESGLDDTKDQFGATENLPDEKPMLIKKTSLKDLLSMTDENGEYVTLNNKGLDNLIEKDEEDLSDEERMLLYEKAVSFQHLGSMNHALLCFLGCLKGLQPSSKSKFTMLPQCLTHIAEIYAVAGDYQKAVEFMQGTKLYYETAIIEAGIQVDGYKKENGTQYCPLDLDPSLDEAKRANEYERLSNSCLEQKKFQLALEYCGKATKLRQKVYGDDHPLTVKSLDLFTLIYAEMGKSQYSEAMRKYGDLIKNKEVQEEPKTSEASVVLDKEEQPTPTSTAGDALTPTAGNAPTYTASDSSTDVEFKTDEKEIQDKTAGETIKDLQDEGLDEQTLKGAAASQEKEVTFSRAEVSSLKQITACELLFFLIISAILAVFITVLWCYFSESPACPSQRYMYSQARYWYYFYFKSAATNASFY